jgi:dihydrofolate reductase
VDRCGDGLPGVQVSGARRARRDVAGDGVAAGGGQAVVGVGRQLGSTTLESVSSAKTRIERTFDPDAVRKLKAEADHDLSVDGPNLAGQAIAAGLVDEYHLFMTTSVVGGGKRFFPDGVRLDLELVEERAFDSGLIYARYRTR